MREPKFRYYVQHDGTGEWKRFEYTLEEIRCTDRYEVAKVDNTIRWDVRAVVQCTGMMDEAGKEIYEGDILQYEWDVWGVVTWDDSGYRYYLRDNYDNLGLDEFEIGPVKVLGNIYENPDLLQQYAATQYNKANAADP
jgi:hypothetical protein